MKQITFSDIVNLNISPCLCYQWVSKMIADKKESILPPKISMKPADDVFCNVMPAILSEKLGG